MKLNRLTATALLLVSAASLAAQVFINYEDNCMTRLQYSYASTTESYLAYQVRQSLDDVLTIDVGSDKTPSKLPAKATARSCSSLLNDPNLVSQINNGQTDLYIVDKQNGVRVVYRALLASRLKTTNQILIYESAYVSLAQPINNLSGGFDLAGIDSKYSVFYKGNTINCGLTAYLFRREPRETCYPPGDFMLLSGIGLVEEIIYNGENTSLYKLASVNNQDICAFINRPVQITTQRQEQQATTTYNQVVIANPLKTKPQQPGQPAQMSQTVFKTETIVKTDTVVLCPPSNTAGRHVVQKGETLFAISRKYGLTVAQLKSFNDLQSDTISLCAELTVVAPASYSAVEFTTKSAVRPVAPKPTTKPAAVAKPATQTKTQTKTLAKSVARTKPASKQTSAKPAAAIDTKATYHTAVCGETLYGIARKYGYTTERLAQMNKISVNAPLACGQKLIVNDCACAAPATPGASTTKNKTTAALNGTTVKGGTPTSYNQPQTFIVAARQTHVVKNGETLADISRIYNMPASKIRQLNRLDAGEIVIPNQVLIVSD